MNELPCRRATFSSDNKSTVFRYISAPPQRASCSRTTPHSRSDTMSNAEDNVKAESKEADPNIVSIKVRGQVRVSLSRV